MPWCDLLGATQVTAIVNSTGVPRACTLISGLNNPEGLVYVNGSLFVGQVILDMSAFSGHLSSERLMQEAAKPVLQPR